MAGGDEDGDTDAEGLAFCARSLARGFVPVTPDAKRMQRMGSVRRGFRIAVDAVRGWRGNPMMPFVLRGVAGGKHRIRLAACAVLMVLAMAAAAHVAIVLNREVFEGLRSIAGFAYGLVVGPAVFVTGVLWTPLLWFFIVATACGLIVRRWTGSAAFRRDLGMLPQAGPDLAAALVVLIFGIAAFSELASSATKIASELLGLAPQGTVPALYRIANSKLAREHVLAGHLGFGTPTVPAAMALFAECFVRILSMVVAIGRISTYFALLVTSRSAWRAFAAIAGLRVLESLLATVSWWISSVGARMAGGVGDYGKLMQALLLGLLDFAYAPFLAALWACAACWAAARLHDGMERILAAGE